MLIEHGGQVLSPAVARVGGRVGSVPSRDDRDGDGRTRHGLRPGTAAYAARPVADNRRTFHGMTTVILGSDHDATTALLRVFGGLDFAVCFGLFVPWMRRSVHSVCGRLGVAHRLGATRPPECLRNSTTTVPTSTFTKRCCVHRTS